MRSQTVTDACGRLRKAPPRAIFKVRTWLGTVKGAVLRGHGADLSIMGGPLQSVIAHLHMSDDVRKISR